MHAFLSADILIPQQMYLETWPVIACDQFTSDPAYWQRCRSRTQGIPSAMHLVLPEAELGSPEESTAIAQIQKTMDSYLSAGIFREYPSAYVYVERTLANGTIRPGLVGMVDLEQYDYRPGSVSPIRATEQTVLERIPPRQRVRRGAALELPHVLMLCDDAGCTLIEPITCIRETLPRLYSLDLMENGGHLDGWLLCGEVAEAFDRRFEAFAAATDARYPDLDGAKVLLAVGDGNHSLATAKSCYEEQKAAHPERDFSHDPARFALVELENLHDPSIIFEPIHRLIAHTDPKAMVDALKGLCAPGGYPVTWVSGTERGTLELDPRRGELAAAVLQNFLDDYLSAHPGQIDYIHGEAETCALAAAPDAIGFLLPPIGKSQLFRGVIAGGILPRKTFSMGHAREKRYYLEGRKIR